MGRAFGECNSEKNFQTSRAFFTLYYMTEKNINAPLLIFTKIKNFRRTSWGRESEGDAVPQLLKLGDFSGKTLKIRATKLERKYTK